MAPPRGADEATLKTRTLTNLYNARPAWLANAHAALDQAVWAAYGWDDSDPAATPEDTVLARLLALNLERAVGRSGSGATSPPLPAGGGAWPCTHAVPAHGHRGSETEPPTSG